MYDTWERRNAVIPLDLETISGLLQPAFPGARAVRAEAAAGGLGNTVYRVEVAGRKEPVALRICQRDPDASEREVHLWKLIGGMVPMPKVFHGSATGGPDGLAYNLSAWVDAEPLDAVLHRVEGKEAASLAAAVGETLAAIGSYSFPRAGFFGRNLSFAFTFENGVVDGFFAHLEECLFRGAAGHILGEDFARRLWSSVMDILPDLEPIRDARSLVHSDFRAANILVRRDTSGWCVAAVIDWDFVHSGCPLSDVAVLLRHRESLPENFVDAFLRAYAGHGGTLPDNWRRIARFLDIVHLCDILNASPDRPQVVQSITRYLSEGL